MEKTVEEKGLQLEDLKVSSLPELQGWKEKQKQLVVDNPFVEITDNKTYEVACKSRTALLRGRTELEKQDKLIASQLTSFRKDVKSETETLIAITLPFEEKQQTEVKRYEAIKIAEKEEEARLEQERIEKIKTKIDSFETDSYKIIQETTIENVEMHKTMLDAFVNDEFDYEEYDIMFEQAKMRIQSSWDFKCNDIQEKEEQRLRNLELEKENKRLRNENLERENKAKSDKEKIFEIRKSRLARIGVTENENGWFVSENEDSLMNLEFVYNCNEVEFEEAIAESIEAIKTGNLQREEAENQKAIDLELSKADAERLKKENKARVKRLASDKKQILEFIKSLDFRNAVPELDNVEMQGFLDGIIQMTTKTKTELSIQLEKL